jgi:hypothetical protein
MNTISRVAPSIMTAESSGPNHLPKAEYWLRFLNRAALLLLLLAVPALSTAAKISWYLPQASAGHNLTAAIKLKVAHSPRVLDWQQVQLIVKVVPPEPQIRTSHQADPEPESRWTCLTFPLQHRSPPLSLV